MEKPVQVERYGQNVWEISEMDKIRKEHCMCHHCGKINIPTGEGKCEIAQKFYEICKQYGNAFILTRCMEWTEKK